MPDPRHNPDPLGLATDTVIAAITALLPTDKQPLAEALGRSLGRWCEELIGRATALAAGAVVHVHKRVESLEARERRRSDRLDELQRTVNGQVDRIWAYQLPEDQRNSLITLIHQLAERVEALERAVGDNDASNAAQSGQS